MKTKLPDSIDKTLEAEECVGFLPWRGVLLHPHFQAPANLPLSRRGRQKVIRPAWSNGQALSDSELAQGEVRMRELIQNTTPQEREILRKLGFKVREAFRQASLLPKGSHIGG
jgi:hypothetical protein